MKAKSIKGATNKEIATRLDEALRDGFQPTLAIVFISIKEELDKVRTLLKNNGLQIFGSSSGSEFIDAEISTGAIAVLLLDLNPAYFQIILKERNGLPIQEAAAQLGKAALQRFRHPSFLLISGNATIDGDAMMDGIKEAAGTNTVLYGGLAADDLKMTDMYVFTDTERTEDGLLSLVFDNEKVKLSGRTVGDWRPVGLTRTITSSKGHTVFTIDDEPALDFVLRYSGISNEEMESYMLFLYSNFQFQLLRENRHAIMRAPLQASLEDRSITFSADMPQGSKIRLCLLPGFEVVDTAVKEFGQLKAKQPEADALVMFSCAARKLCLGPYVHNEIEAVKKAWHVPMVGFFCYGEIGNVAESDYEFHNMACSLALLKEV